MAAEAQTETLDTPAATLPLGPATTDETFTFHGNGAEYFRIWIVNVFLTIITLGAFSAWAKVRKRRYFYRNTRVMGDRFDYLADPRRILIGRAIILPVLLVYLLGDYFIFGLGFAALALIVLVLPFFLVKAARFNARNTTFRHVRFGFDGKVSTSYLEFLKAGLTTLVTLGLAMPLMEYARRRFMTKESRFGDQEFFLDSEFGKFYVIYIKAMGLGILAGFGLGIITLQLLPNITFGDSETGLSINYWIYVPTILGFVVYYGLWIYVQVRAQNFFVNRTTLGDHQLKSTLSASKLFGIHLANLVLIVCTFGLFMPFASIRVLKYKLSQTQVSVREGFDQIAARGGSESDAMGEEVGDMFDFDLGI